MGSRDLYEMGERPTGGEVDLEGRVAALEAEIAFLRKLVPVEQRSIEDIIELYAKARTAGVITTAVNGLGSKFVEPGEYVQLTDTINRMHWPRKLTLQVAGLQGCPLNLVVDHVTIAGLPLNIGNRPSPAEAFRELALDGGGLPAYVLHPGQMVMIGVTNLATTPVSVTAAIHADEISAPLYEETLVRVLTALAGQVTGPAERRGDRALIETALAVHKQREARDGFVQETP